jgi:hypothetical protein
MPRNKDDNVILFFKASPLSAQPASYWLAWQHMLSLCKLVDGENRAKRIAGLCPKTKTTTLDKKNSILFFCSAGFLLASLAICVIIM